jgi:CRISPR/Cas system CSM-associated protein Csm3 (group 7 of RAMP superfamily)
MTNDPPLYKTLIMGELVQITAFSIGGNNPHGRVDAPVARNGGGDLTIRGTGLAGALIALARKLTSDEKLLRRISFGPPSEQSERRDALRKGREMERLPESLWRFHNAHPIGGEPALEVRSGVGIRQDTGAAATGLKFETETVPAGTRWRFLMEVDDYREGRTNARALALCTLREWEEGHCFLGRDVARGLGWMGLRDVQVRVLSTEHRGDWPNAYKTPEAAFNALSHIEPLSDEKRRECESAISLLPRQVLSGRGTIQVGGADDDAWGLDTLSLGGSESVRPMQEKVVTKASLSLPPIEKLEPDSVLAWTRPASAPDSAARPFIPGSSLRGPLRHALSWWLRRNGAVVADPNRARDREGEKDPVAELFGTVERSAALLLSDAMLEEGEDAKPLFMEQHAEDEFSAGACGPMKFNRLCLSSGRFGFRFFVEIPPESSIPDPLAGYRKLLEDLAELGDACQLPIGGGQWRGHGWVQWHWEWDKPRHSEGR